MCRVARLAHLDNVGDTSNIEDRSTVHQADADDPAPGKPTTELPSPTGIRDLATVKAIAHPLRFRILGRLADGPHTVKEVAAGLGRPPDRLYYHVRILEQHGVVEVADERLVSGIVERRYRLTGAELSLDPSDRDLARQATDFMADALRQELRAAAAVGAEGTLLSRTMVSLTAEQRGELQARLRAFLEDVTRDYSGDGDPFTLTIALYQAAADGD